MPTTTPKLGLPRPVGSDLDTRANNNALIDAIDSGAAAQTQVDRPFNLLSAVYDNPNNRLVVTLGAGRAAFLNTIVNLASNSTVYVAAPSINTTYYVYLKSDGSFTSNMTGGTVTGAVLLWQVITGATLSTLSWVDQRGELPGASGRIVQDALSAHQEASVLDHPDGSVTNSKLGPGCVTADKLAPGAAFPPGVIMSYPVASAPAGWLLCDGSAVSRTGYANLFGVTGTTFGIGDGTTTFNLPDLRGRAIVALDNLGGSAAGRIPSATSIGANGGEANHTLSSGELPGHTHPIGGSSGANSNDHTHGVGIVTDSQGTHTHPTDSQGSHNHELPAQVGGSLNSPSGTLFNGGGGATDGGIWSATNGAHTHTAQSAGSHQHNVNGNTGGTSASHAHALPATTGLAGSGTAHNNLQPFIALAYIIKT